MESNLPGVFVEVKLSSTAKPPAAESSMNANDYQPMTIAPQLASYSIFVCDVSAKDQAAAQ